MSIIVAVDAVEQLIITQSNLDINLIDDTLRDSLNEYIVEDKISLDKFSLAVSTSELRKNALMYNFLFSDSVTLVSFLYLYTIQNVNTVFDTLQNKGMLYWINETSNVFIKSLARTLPDTINYNDLARKLRHTNFTIIICILYQAVGIDEEVIVKLRKSARLSSGYHSFLIVSCIDNTDSVQPLTNLITKFLQLIAPYLNFMGDLRESNLKEIIRKLNEIKSDQRNTKTIIANHYGEEITEITIIDSDEESVEEDSDEYNHNVVHGTYTEWHLYHIQQFLEEADDPVNRPW